MPKDCQFFSAEATSRSPFKGLVFGAASIGGLYEAISDEDAAATLDEARRQGFQLFDTALEYGAGESERRLGDYISEHEEIVVSTKVGDVLVADPTVKGNAWWPAQTGVRIDHDFRADAIEAAIEGAQARLRRARLDAVSFHDLDKKVLGEAFEQHFQDVVTAGYPVLKRLRDAGTIGAIGLGVKEWQVCDRCLDLNLDFDYFMLQGSYTLLEQTIPDAFLERCRQAGIGIIIAGPFNSGILVRGSSDPAATFHHVQADASIRRRVEALEALCDSHGVELAAAALQFPLRDPRIQAVAVGLRTPEEVRQCRSWQQVEIPEVFWDEYSNLSTPLGEKRI